MLPLSIGILAHVDSGKTTLSEALLYTSGNIKKLGRVDNKDATLDTHNLEKKRGITIFSKQAKILYNNFDIALLDTPGHTDFSAETERTLSVLDYAILVINGLDGVQNHTQTLWKLLKKHSIPTFIFVNKIDMDNVDKALVFNEITQKLSEKCVNFTDMEDFFENISLCDEKLLEEYLENNKIHINNIKLNITKRNIFPCFFGSALKLIGVQEFLDGICDFAKIPTYSNNFSAKVYKISRDLNGTRLTHLKITGGSLKVKQILSETNEKVDNIRIYSGEKFESVKEVPAGAICAVTGLNNTYIGQGFCENDNEMPVLRPILNYKIILNKNDDPILVYEKLKELAEEDPLLNIIWEENEINLRIMGDIQIEILQNIIKERYNIDVSFDTGSILYKETIVDRVEGVGHFEPLRHYAEVRLLFEPQKEGTGLKIASKCEGLDKNFEHLVLHYLHSCTHRGALTGSEITDMKITLVSGRAHKKHTEGGDFRQATLRAVQNGLRRAKSVLLEPYYAFRIEVPSENIGRVMSDITKMKGEFTSPETLDDKSIITGMCPVFTMQNYHKDIISFTKGVGKFQTELKGYFKCHNSDEIIQNIAFDYTNHPDCNPDSVFCSHGSGFNVKWDEVEDFAHTPKHIIIREQISPQVVKSNAIRYSSSLEMDKELLKIFEKTYGTIKTDKFLAFNKAQKTVDTTASIGYFDGDEYLLVDGYNIIFAWDDLSAIAKDNIELAREKLINTMCNYKGFKGSEVVVVFDAYKVKGKHREVEKYHNINIVYTKEAETADMYIEKVTKDLAKKRRVRVATSDALEQLIIWGHGAHRVSASALKDEIMHFEKIIEEFCM